ncbi:MAG: hypothetical protein HQK72_07335 [Desulfamplus sp.]|nr:hypothetical protein [Desulfamplus sp.]
MQDIITLLTPRFRSIYNQGRIASGKGGIYKYLLILTLGIIFWVGSLYISLRVLRYFSQIDQMGDILAFKLLSMVIVTIFSLLIFSNILNALSKLYLAKDLKLVHSMPVESYRIFLARWIETTLDSSWMVILYTLPVFVAYGWIYSPEIFFYFAIIISLMLLAVGASAVASILVMTAVVIVPASRIRTIFIFLGLSLFILLYIAFRILRPERLVDPEVFSATLFYFKSMNTPSSPFLPSTWCYDAITAALKNEILLSSFHIFIAFSFVLFIGFIMVVMADIVYFSGVSKAQTSAARLLGGIKLWGGLSKGYRFLRIDKLLKLLRIEYFFKKFVSGAMRALFIKEIKTFFRDQTQWSQLFLIGALVCIYIYNFKVLPLEKSPIQTIYLQNMLAFLNMGLAFFVLTAITGRFAFPAISMEGEAIWIIRSSPIELKSFIWIKYLIYLVPLIILTFILIIGTNILLKVVPFMMVLSCINTFFIVPGVLSLGIGLGAAFPSFKSENPSQTVTSYGGLLFMIFSALFIGTVIVLQAGPVYMILSSQFKSKPLVFADMAWICISFLAALIISILMTFLPMKFGEKRLKKILFDM